jgi:antitoxin FitA
MLGACKCTKDMSKMIQIRDVPDEVHRQLKARAAHEGMSLSEFLKREITRTVERPTINAWFERVRESKPIVTKQSAAELIRELRDGR